MTTKQTALIREASQKEVGAHRWRIRMEEWMELDSTTTNKDFVGVIQNWPKYWRENPARI